MRKYIFLSKLLAFFFLIACSDSKKEDPTDKDEGQSTTNDNRTGRIGALKFENGFPTAETSKKLFDEMDFQRAVQAYIWAYPVVSFESIRLAAHKDYGV